MKTCLSFLFICFFQNIIFSQCPIPEAMSTQDGNNIEAMILNGGDLFWDGGNGHFIAPADDPIPKNTMFTAALWMGGIAADGQLKLSAQTYGRSSGSFDYITGAIVPDDFVDENHCANFNKIWKVTKAEIDAHKADFADNGTIDNPIENIFGWPGKSNYSFFQYNEFPLPNYSDHFAPFHDTNGNDIYEPELGDYPHSPKTISGLTPASINWCIFNDSTSHNQTGGLPIQAEVHLTSWSFDCPFNFELNNTVFTSHKIINKSDETLDSFLVSLWVDFDLGCYLDDYIGSSPEQHAFFAYNSDSVDGESSPEDCQGVETYGYQHPAQSVQFLNKKMDYFTYFNGPPGVLPPPADTFQPETPTEYFNYMTGRWAVGIPLTQGGDGYNPTSTEYVDYAFPDNPNDPEGWSMHQEGLANGDRRNVSTHQHGTFAPNEVIKLDIAYTFHYYNSIPDHLEIVDKMYLNIDKVQQMYDMQFNGWCGVVTDTEEPSFSRIKISPNPSSGIFNLKTDQIETIGLELFDISGRLLWKETAPFSASKSLNFSFLENGVYILKTNTSQGVFSKKLLIQKE